MCVYQQVGLGLGRCPTHVLKDGHAGTYIYIISMRRSQHRETGGLGVNGGRREEVRGAGPHQSRSSFLKDSVGLFLE